MILNIVQGTPQNFTTIDGDKKMVPMMTRTSLQNTGARFETEIVPDVIFTTVVVPYAVRQGRACPWVRGRSQTTLTSFFDHLPLYVDIFYLINVDI